MRVVMYYITLLLKDADEEKRDVMSDHVFLAMSIVCLARFELYCCLETLESNKYWPSTHATPCAAHKFPYRTSQQRDP